MFLWWALGSCTVRRAKASGLFILAALIDKVLRDFVSVNNLIISLFEKLAVIFAADNQPK